MPFNAILGVTPPVPPRAARKSSVLFLQSSLLRDKNIRAPRNPRCIGLRDMESLLQSAKDLVNAGLALIYPEICQLCCNARATPADSFICTDCRQDVRYIQPPYCSKCGLPFEGAITQSFECSHCRSAQWEFQSARSAVIAQGKVLEVIHRYKYQRALWFEPFLADLLIQRARPELRPAHWDWLVPVPLHPTKQREREFNQAERLARRLGEAIGIPLKRRLLARVQPTASQTLLNREERQGNVRRAFVYRPKQRLEGRRIVLIDDVFTTGATTGECARVLRQAGADAVCVWTVARGV